MKTKFFAAFAAVACLVIVATSCKRPEPEPDPEPEYINTIAENSDWVRSVAGVDTTRLPELAYFVMWIEENGHGTEETTVNGLHILKEVTVRKALAVETKCSLDYTDNAIGYTADSLKNNISAITSNIKIGNGETLTFKRAYLVNFETGNEELVYNFSDALALLTGNFTDILFYWSASDAAGMDAVEDEFDAPEGISTYYVACTRDDVESFFNVEITCQTKDYEAEEDPEEGMK